MKAIFIIFPLIFSIALTSQSNITVNNQVDSNLLSLTEIEKEWLREHPVITVGADINWAPFEFMDSDGNFKGLHIDYLNYIEHQLKVKFEFAKNKSWQNIIEKAVSKEIDVVIGMVPTPKRTKHHVFTTPYQSYPIALFAKEGTPFIRDISELAGKKVGIIDDYFIEEILVKNYPAINVVTSRDIKEGFKNLDNGKIYVFIASIPTGSYHLYEDGYKSIRIVGETPFKYDICMGVRNDWPVLRDILQKALDSMPQTKKNNIYNNWISLRTKKFDYSILWKILTPVLAVLIYSLYWNQRLTREVKKRKKAQKELDNAFKRLKDTQTHLVQTEKLASIGLLTAGIAHEINNPVNFLSFGVNKLQETTDTVLRLVEKYNLYISNDTKISLQEIKNINEELEFNQFKEEYPTTIKHIQTGINRIIEITKSLNAFSRVSGNEKSLANINEGIELALILLKNQHKYDIEIVKELDDLPEIKCFPGKLSQVFVNIIANAIQAIERKGTIWIKTYKENATIKISIKDNGSGIEKEQLDKIFESFYTTKPIGEGTGLGLAISKNIINEHDGTIEVYSEPNLGTEFIITLPTK